MEEILQKVEEFMFWIENCNLYRIYEEDGVKQIKLLCFYYKNDDGWQLVEYCWGDITLEYFLSDEFNIDDFECSLKQYQTHIGDILKAFNSLAHYAGADDGLKGYNVIRWEDITMDTPCGLYLVQ